MQRAQRIKELLSHHLHPSVLDIEDESHRHHVPQGLETHFKLTIVTTLFDEMTRIARHRLINTLLASEFKNGLHALSLHLYSPTEWENREKKAPASPPCRDGFDQ
jgi:BolA protein